jgi:hypothetical protein
MYSGQSLSLRYFYLSGWTSQPSVPWTCTYSCEIAGTTTPTRDPPSLVCTSSVPILLGSCTSVPYLAGTSVCTLLELDNFARTFVWQPYSYICVSLAFYNIIFFDTCAKLKEGKLFKVSSSIKSAVLAINTLQFV